MDQRHLCETVLFFLKTKATSGYGILLKHIFLLSYNHKVVLWSLQLDLIIQRTE